MTSVRITEITLWNMYLLTWCWCSHSHSLCTSRSGTGRRESSRSESAGCRATGCSSAGSESARSSTRSHSAGCHAAGRGGVSRGGTARRLIPASPAFTGAWCRRLRDHVRAGSVGVRRLCPTTAVPRRLCQPHTTMLLRLLLLPLLVLCEQCCFHFEYHFHFEF